MKRALIALLSSFAATPAFAFETVVVAAASDRGYGPDVPLRYAEADAANVIAAFDEVGSTRAIRAVLGQDAHALQDALLAAKDDVRDAKRLGAKTMLIFYYSGHADGDYLRMGGSRVTWAKLKELIGGAGADLVVAMIDACDSGSATSAKGATYALPLVESALEPTRGSMWISSSRENEASYESDELGGSFFSHFFVSGLRGAADLDEDGKVTLSEVYQFTYDRTVGETSLRLRRAQHPTYRSDLEGEGEIVLSELHRSTTSIVLPRETSGQWFVTRRFGSKRSVLEVPKQPGLLVRMSVPPGAYLVYRKDPERVMVTEVQVFSGEEVVIEPASLRARSYAEVVEKGGGISVAAWRVRGGASLSGPIFAGASAPLSLELGVERKGRSLGLALAINATRYRFQAIDTSILTYQLTAAVTAEVFAELSWASAGVGLGPAIAFTSQQTSKRTLSTFSPGLAGAAFIERPVFGPVAIAARFGLSGFVVSLVDRRELELVPFASLGVAVALD